MNKYKISSLNCATSRGAMDAFLSTHAKSTHFVLFQEPSWSFLGNDKWGTLASPDWLCILPFNPSLATEKNVPLVVTFVNKTLLNDIRIAPRFDLTYNSPNTQVIDIHDSIRLINHYTPSTKKESWDYGPVFDHFDSTTLPTVLMGDFNARHTTWDRTCRVNRGHATKLFDLAHSKGLRIHNDGRPTYFGWYQEVRSAIDLTISNTDPDEASYVDGWGADITSAPNSDHGHTWIDFRTNQALPDLKGRPNYCNWKNTDEELFGKTLRELLEASPISFDSEGDPQNMFNALDAAIANAYNVATKAKRVITRSKPWWSRSLTKLNKDAQDARAVLRGKIKKFGHGSVPVIDQARIWRKLTNIFDQAEKVAKTAHFESVLKDVLPNTIWKKAGAWGKGIRKYISPPLKDKNGSIVTDTNEKAKIFHQTFYPHKEASSAPLPRIPIISQREFVPVTRAEVESAVHSISNQKAPGPSGLPNALVKLTWKYAPMELYSIVAASIHHHSLPSQWKFCTVAVIPKPGKPDYSTARAYRPIALLESISKIVEIVVSRRLSADCSTFGLAPQQYGCVPGRSTTDALVNVIHVASALKEEGKLVSLMKFDIKGYFNSIPHHILIHLLRCKGIAEPLVQWIDVFLKDVLITYRIDGHMSESHITLRGVPQGSPLSPILSVLFSSEILRYVQQKLIACAPNGDSPLKGLPMYIDDGCFVVAHTNATAVVPFLLLCKEALEEWASDFDVEIDRQKYETLHLWKAPADLRLEHASQMKYLGVIIDSKLTFSSHVDDAIRKASKPLGQLIRIKKRCRGISPEAARTFYMAAIRTIFCYASPAWRPFAADYLIDRLDTFQNRCLRIVAGAVRSTPIYPLQALVAIAPIRLHLYHLECSWALSKQYAPPMHPTWAIANSSYSQKPTKVESTAISRLVDRTPIAFRRPFLARPMPWMVKNVHSNFRTLGTLAKDPAVARKTISLFLSSQFNCFSVSLHKIPRGSLTSPPISKWAVSVAIIDSPFSIVHSSHFSYLVPNVDSRHIESYAAAILLYLIHSEGSLLSTSRLRLIISNQKLFDYLARPLSPHHELPATLYTTQLATLGYSRTDIAYAPKGCLDLLSMTNRFSSANFKIARIFSIPPPRSTVSKAHYMEHLEQFGNYIALGDFPRIFEAEIKVWPLIGQKMRPASFANLLYLLTGHSPHSVQYRYAGHPKPYPCKCGAAEDSADHIINDCPLTVQFKARLPWIVASPLSSQSPSHASDSSHWDMPLFNNLPTWTWGAKYRRCKQRVQTASSLDIPLATRLSLAECMRDHDSQELLGAFLHASGVLYPRRPSRD